MVGAAVPADDGARLWAVLESVPDPELPVLSIVDLGIVRSADARSRRVAITPTYTGCPATQVIQASVRAALDGAGFADVEIVTELAPAWTSDWISAGGREKLRAYGIASPTSRGVRAALCPQCGSPDTVEVSRFGSTPCKAQWRCTACAEPFDLFKCH